MKPSSLLGTLGVILFGCGEPFQRHDLAETAPDSLDVRIVANSFPGWSTADVWVVDTVPRIAISSGIQSDGPLMAPRNVQRSSNGSWIVTDRVSDHQAVMVYSPTGELLRILGRSGGGPCEFRNLYWAIAYRGDSIAAYDFSRHTIFVFGPDGECTREISLPNWDPGLGPNSQRWAKGADGAFGDGSFLTRTTGYLDVERDPGVAWFRQRFVRVHLNGVDIDTLGVLGIAEKFWEESALNWYPYGRELRLAIHGNRYYTTTGSAFEVRIWSDAGELVEIWQREFERLPVSSSDRGAFDAWYDGTVRSRVRGAGDVQLIYPELKPATSSILVDALGNAWVEEFQWLDDLGYPPPSVRGRWTVFSSDGSWLGEVILPPRFLPTWIGDDVIAGIHVDENDARHVHVYAVLKGSANTSQ